jgi:GntR family transcriptional regulator, carbon starvation induced regulator
MTFEQTSASILAIASAKPKRRSQRADSADRSEAIRLAPTTARGGAAKRRLYRRLLSDILQGRLAPARPLCMRDLAREYGTSTTSVRQVLIELVRDRLVSGGVSGYEVAPASQSELLDLTQTAYWLGEIGLRESIRRGDRQWEENVLRAYRAVELANGPASTEESVPSRSEQMLAFYDALVSACHSSILTGQCRSLNERLLRYRNLAAVATGRDHQHGACVPPLRDAVLARNTELATELLRSHYRLTEHGILASGILV